MNISAQPQLSHSDRLRLLNAVDDLCLPWQVDLVLRHELPAELETHVQRVGRCLWTAASRRHPSKAASRVQLPALPSRGYGGFKAK